MTRNWLSSPASVARLGVPVVVGIFYVAASLGFDYTAESAMAMASFVRDGLGFPLRGESASPLWEFLLTAGAWFHLDALLTGKVLSLLFSSLAVFLGYLVAYEILRDHVVALCVSLIVAMQGWLLQTAPSGSALSAAAALVLAVLFFMLRNEYAVASFLLGLCTLLFWQAVFLLVPVCVDIWINSVKKRRAAAVVFSACLAYVGPLVLWLVFAWTNHREVIPVMAGGSELPGLAVLSALTIAVPGACGLSGLVFAAPGVLRDRLRGNAGALLFLIALPLIGLMTRIDVGYAALPLVLVFGFWGLAETLRRFSRENLLYAVLPVLTGLLLIGVQLDYFRENRHSMAVAVTRTRELQSVASWIMANSQAGQKVCAEDPAVIQYYAERPVLPLDPNASSGCDLVVSSGVDIPGYEMAFSTRTRMESVAVQRYVVWRKK